MMYIAGVGIPTIILNNDDTYRQMFFSWIREIPLWVGEGDDLNGFKSPMNYVGNKSDFFARFGLWENQNGWGVQGVQRVPMNNINSFIAFPNPASVGDWVMRDNEKYFITSAKGTFDRAFNVWKGVYTLSDSLPKIKEPDSYTNLYFNAINEQMDYMTDFIDSYTNGATAPNGSVTFPNSPAAKNNYKEKMKNITDNRL